MPASPAFEVTEKVADPLPASYGLRRNILSPLETLAQSVSTIAPSTSPTMTIPLVFALAGTGTWLAYAFAMVALVLVALCIAEFAKDSASPGSLYVYTRDTLPPAFGAVAAFALLFAYLMTASSVIGGFVAYAYVVLGRWGAHVSPVLLTLIAAGTAVAIAYRDIKISAQLMLWIEAVSVFLIAVVIAIVLWQNGLHLDPVQTRLQGASAMGVRLGVMLALFSFVGFESATTLGEEAREPLKTIPQAVLRSAVLAGIFFILCAYGEVLGFHGAASALGDSTSPMRTLTARAGIAFIAPVIDLGVLISMFAATLACVIAGARVLMLMAHHGLAHSRFKQTNAQHETPGAAGLLTGAIAVCPAAVLAVRGATGWDIYGWMGTLATFGFLTAYGLVAIALPVHLRRRGTLTPGKMLLASAAALAMLFAAFGTIFPIPPAPYRYLPYVYVAYMACAMLWYARSSRPVAAI